MKTYKIVPLINETYQVVDDDEGTVWYQGNLANCEAYVDMKTR